MAFRNLNWAIAKTITGLDSPESSGVFGDFDRPSLASSVWRIQLARSALIEATCVKSCLLESALKSAKTSAVRCSRSHLKFMAAIPNGPSVAKRQALERVCKPICRIEIHLNKFAICGGRAGLFFETDKTAEIYLNSFDWFDVPGMG